MRRAHLICAIAMVAACKGSSETDQGAALPPTPAPSTTLAPPQAAPLPPPVAEPNAEEIPLPEDFSESAAQQITSKTYKTELDRLAQQILSASAP